MSLSNHFWNLITLWASTRWQGLTMPWVKEYPLLRGLNLPLGFIGRSLAFALPANMGQHILHVCWAVSGSYTPGWGVPEGCLGLNKAQLAEAELSEAWGTTVGLWGGRHSAIPVLMMDGALLPFLQASSAIERGQKSQLALLSQVTYECIF